MLICGVLDKLQADCLMISMVRVTFQVLPVVEVNNKRMMVTSFHVFRAYGSPSREIARTMKLLSRPSQLHVDLGDLALANIWSETRENDVSDHGLSF